MKMKFRAAVGSLLVSAAVAGAAVAPAASSAHGGTGPLCWGNLPGGVEMWGSGGVTMGILAYGESFRIDYTINAGGYFVSKGHSASSYPVDYYVYTNQLRCDHPPT